MRTMVVITSLEDKPIDCTECPLCNEYDECQALPWHDTRWETQYKNCPLKVLRIKEKGDAK